jgi:hypothetical protein
MDLAVATSAYHKQILVSTIMLHIPLEMMYVKREPTCVFTAHLAVRM